MIEEQVAIFVIAAETNDSHFERFCTDLLTASENVQFVTTSTTYDRGRDARAMGRSRGSHSAVLCASLNREVDAKADADLSRLSETTDPDRVIYCSSQRLTEHQIDKLTANVRSKFPSRETSIQIHGAHQLAFLSTRYPDVFQRHYAAELRNLEQVLNPVDPPSEEASTRGLRLALMTFGTEEGTALRAEMSRRAIMDVLRAGQQTPAVIAKSLSDALRLPIALSPQYVEQVLRELAAAELVEATNGAWDLTAGGREEADAISPDAAQALVAGRQIVREHLSEHLGFQLSDDHFNRAWSTLLDALSDLFFRNGIAVVEGIRELLDPAFDGSGAGAELKGLLTLAAQRVAATAETQEQAEVLVDAVTDLLTERNGKTFEWLTRVAERFVALVALGLESTSADEIKDILRREMIVLDTDVLLTYLGVGEPEHTLTSDLLRKWRRIGGKVLLFTPILSEVAYHAWIAERDYEEVRPYAGKLGPRELKRYARNAFVRSYFASGGRGSWKAYIDTFRGVSENDYRRIQEIASEELAAETLPDQFDERLRDEIRSDLEQSIMRQRNTNSLDLRETDKARRDGQILASIAAARKVQIEAGSGRTVLLLSSSSRLRRTESRFRQQLGRPPAVISLAALAYLISMIPGTHLGAGALRRALFEFGEAAPLTDVQRLALRVIKGSGAYQFPWAQRGRLRRELEALIHKEAQARGTEDRDIERQFLGGAEEIRPAAMIAEALSRIAVSDVQSEALRVAEQQNRAQQAIIDQLQDELKRLRRR